MKLKFLFSLSAAAVLSASLAAQQPTAKIHGRVIDPTGMPKGGGTIGLSQDNGATSKFSFTVDPNGNYTGDGIAPGTYSVIYRAADTAVGKVVDKIDNVKIAAGADMSFDDDMSRQAYIDQMTPDQKKQVEEFKKKNADIMKSNAMVKNLNADLQTARADNKEGDQAHTTAVTALGATASKTDIAAKETEIKTTKYGEAETLMAKDAALRPDAAMLFVELGNAQSGLGKYDDASASFKKAIDTNTASKKPDPALEGAAQSGMATVYLHQKKTADAATAMDAAAKAAPAQASLYYSNFAKLLYSLNSTGTLSDPDAQNAAADKAIAATPATTTPAYALLFYLKAQALTQKASFDAKTQKIVLPPGTAEAYQKYLDLDPNGTFANDSRDVLASAGQKVDTKYKAKK
jgi:tetratricopeptide (TPR) repeat protein